MGEKAKSCPVPESLKKEGLCVNRSVSVTRPKRLLFICGLKPDIAAIRTVTSYRAADLHTQPALRRMRRDPVVPDQAASKARH